MIFIFKNEQMCVSFLSVFFFLLQKFDGEHFLS